MTKISYFAAALLLSSLSVHALMEEGLRGDNFSQLNFDIDFSLPGFGTKAKPVATEPAPTENTPMLDGLYCDDFSEIEFNVDFSLYGYTCDAARVLGQWCKSLGQSAHAFLRPSNVVYEAVLTPETQELMMLVFVMENGGSKKPASSAQIDAFITQLDRQRAPGDAGALELKSSLLKVMEDPRFSALFKAARRLDDHQRLVSMRILVANILARPTLSGLNSMSLVKLIDMVLDLEAV